MNRMGRSELTLGYIPSTDDMIASYDKVTKEDILSMCGRIFVPEKMSFSALGRSLPPEEYAKILGL